MALVAAAAVKFVVVFGAAEVASLQQPLPICFEFVLIGAFGVVAEATDVVVEQVGVVVVAAAAVAEKAAVVGDDVVRH